MTADEKYAAAMRESGQLLADMREAAPRVPGSVRQILSDVWEHRENTPFVTTLFESAQEMTSPLRQARANGGQMR